ncbi:MAG: LssY C-terminal domain-containing protein [Alphaproteobacteria bacterium]
MHRVDDAHVLLPLGLSLWGSVAYLLMPAVWRRRTRSHPGLPAKERVVTTKDGIPGDPLNVALIGVEDDVSLAMHAAGWFPADPITLRSSIGIVDSALLRRPYPTAPVSNLFLFGRREDLAFEKPVGNDARLRHHVRCLRCESEDRRGRPLWIGAATFDRSVGLSHTTGQVTHHIAAEVDRERDGLLDDLAAAGSVEHRGRFENFHRDREGRNGGGDPWRTDGALAVATLRRPGRTS